MPQSSDSVIKYYTVNLITFIKSYTVLFPTFVRHQQRVAVMKIQVNNKYEDVIRYTGRSIFIICEMMTALMPFSLLFFIQLKRAMNQLQDKA